MFLLSILKEERVSIENYMNKTESYVLLVIKPMVANGSSVGSPFDW